MRATSTTRTARLVIGITTVATVAVAAASPVFAAKSGGHKTDTVPPSVGISSPVPGATLSGIVTVSGTASDNVSVASVAVSVDSGAYQAAAGTTSWSYALNTTAYADGSHMISARATDTSGNATITSVSVSIANAGASVSISSPAAGSTVTGTVNVTGTAADSAGVARVTVSVDGAPAQLAGGTTSWSWSLDTASYSAGSHTVTATATGSNGATASTSESISVGAATAPTTVSITSPAGGATVSGTVSVSGSASSGAGISSVAVSVDGGAYQAATGTGSWTYSLNTAGYGNGSHTITARALDGSDGSATASVSVTVSNSTSGPTCMDGTPVLQQMVTPEGATIDICTSTGGWTTSSIYSLLKANALDLGTVGPHLSVQVQTTYASAESSSAVCCDSSGGYYEYAGIIYLNPSSSQTFSVYPDAIMAHEYGHAWTYYWYYMNPANSASWTSYEQARGIYGNPNVGTTYCWMPFEMAADDYRILFGTTAAASEMSYLNPYVPPPNQVAGLSNWFLTSFR